MAIDIQQEQFKKMLKQIMPVLSLIQNEGIPLEETKEKLLELFINSQESHPARDLADKMNHICYYFRDWLSHEKKISEDRITELSRPLYKLLMETMTEKLEILENEKMGIKAKIINFPEKIK